MLAKIRRRLLTVCPFEFAIVIWCCCFHSRDIQYSDYLVECGSSHPRICSEFCVRSITRTHCVGVSGFSSGLRLIHKVKSVAIGEI